MVTSSPLNNPKLDGKVAKQVVSGSSSRLSYCISATQLNLGKVDASSSDRELIRQGGEITQAVNRGEAVPQTDPWVKLRSH